MKVNLIEIKTTPQFLQRDDPSPLPLIGVMVDEKFPEGPERPFFNQRTYENLTDALKNTDIKMYFILQEDFPKILQILQKIDGLFITGGRDIPPKFYHQEITDSVVFPEVNLRFMITKTVMNEISKKMPIMGTCWGYQFLNVYFGGNLLQDIGDTEKKHSSKVNEIVLDEGSWCFE